MSDKKFYVQSEETCDKCEGSGEVYNEAWKPLNAQWAEIENALQASGKPREEFFDEVELPDGKAFQRKHGAEFLPCGDCEGEGKFTRRVELSEALAAFGITRENVARLEVQMSEVRHRVGITEVDEVYEQVMSEV
jgi:DnaJ-class molecular chaperone